MCQNTRIWQAWVLQNMAAIIPKTPTKSPSYTKSRLKNLIYWFITTHSIFYCLTMDHIFYNSMFIYHLTLSYKLSILVDWVTNEVYETIKIWFFDSYKPCNLLFSKSHCLSSCLVLTSNWWKCQFCRSKVKPFQSLKFLQEASTDDILFKTATTFILVCHAHPPM